MNRVRKYILMAYLTLTPLCYWPTYSRSSQENFFKFAAITVTATFIGNIWLGSFLVLNVILFIYNGGEVGWGQVTNVLLGCLLFTFSRYWFYKNKFSDVYMPIMIVTAITLVFMTLQLFHIDPMFLPGSNAGVLTEGPLGDPIGFFGIKEANGTFLTIALPIVAALNPALSLLLLIPIKLSQSSGVYLAALVVVLFYTWHLHRAFFKWFLILVGIVGVLIISDLHTDPKTFTSRFPVWWNTITHSIRPPSFGLGYGPDSYRNLNKHKTFMFVGDEFYNHANLTTDGKVDFFSYYSPTNDVARIESLTKNIPNTKVSKGRWDLWDNPHNMYINLLFQYGFLGVFLVGGLLREMYYRFKYASKNKELVVITSCLLVYLITGMTNFPLELARTAFFFPILLGAFYNRTDEAT